MKRGMIAAVGGSFVLVSFVIVGMTVYEIETIHADIPSVHGDKSLMELISPEPVNRKRKRSPIDDLYPLHFEFRSSS